MNKQDAKKRIDELNKLTSYMLNVTMMMIILKLVTLSMIC